MHNTLAQGTWQLTTKATSKHRKARVSWRNQRLPRTHYLGTMWKWIAKLGWEMILPSLKNLLYFLPTFDHQDYNWRGKGEGCEVCWLYSNNKLRFPFWNHSVKKCTSFISIYIKWQEGWKNYNLSKIKLNNLLATTIAKKKKIHQVVYWEEA